MAFPVFWVREVAGVIGHHGDLVVLADAAAATLQLANALLDYRHLLLPTRLGQTVGQSGEAGLELPDEAVGDRGLLEVIA